MRWLIGVGVVLVVALVAGAGGFWVWHGNAQLRYERDRATLEWQAARQAAAVASVGGVPDAWGAGLFVSDSGLQAAASTLKGMRITSRKDDVTVTFEDLAVRSKPSLMEVEISLRAESPGRNASLKAKVVAELVFTGLTNRDSETAILRFGLVPVEILPEIRWLGLDWTGRKLASDLISQQVLASMIGRAPLELPVPSGLSAGFGGERAGTIAINKSLGSSLAYGLTLPALQMAGSLRTVSPLFLKGGLWLLASERATDALARLPDPGSRTQEVLVRETGEIRSRLEAIVPPSGDASLWIGSDLLLTAANRIAALPPERRQLAFRSTKVTGHIIESRWRQDLMGGGGAFAEFAGDDALTGTASVIRLVPKWVGGVGLDVETQIDARAAVKVRVQVDPGIGGPQGTVLGLVGDGSAQLGATIAFTADQVDETRVLVVRPRGRCGAMTMGLTTDPGADGGKTDLGWIKIPPIGIKRQQPLDLSVIAPAAILDDLPRSIDGREIGRGRGPGGDPQAREVTVEPAWRYLNARISVLDAAAGEAGWRLGAKIDLVPSQEPVDQVAQARQRERIRAAIGQPGPSSCQGEGSTEVSFGDFKFGPRSEIMKFLGETGQGKGIAGRMGLGESAQKIEEIIRDPGAALGRSDPGRDLKDNLAEPLREFCRRAGC